jgi:hypothetical protein
VLTICVDVLLFRRSRRPWMVHLVVTMHGGSRTGGHIEGTPIITTLISDGTPAGATQGRSFK